MGYRYSVANGEIGIWRGKTGHRTTLSFRTSAHTGVGISIEFQATYRHTGHSFLPFSGIHPRKGVLLSGGLPRQCAHRLAMTWNSTNSNLPQCRFTSKNFIRKLYHNFFKTAMPFRAHLGRKGIIRKKIPIPAKYVFTFRSTCGKMYVVEIGILPTNHRIIL